MATAEDFGRLLADEQVATVRRWGALWEDGTDGLRRLADGTIDGPTYGRERSEDLAREVVLGLESAARVGLEFTRMVADLVEVPQTRPRTDPRNDSRAPSSTTTHD